MGRKQDVIWRVVRAEREALVRDLSGLSEAEWATESLCAGWDVHDVLAHLVDSAKTTRRQFAGRMVAARFDFDADNAAGVARERQQDPMATLAELQRVAGLRATPPAAPATRLVEVIVHGEDIRRPLGIPRRYPAAAVSDALSHQLTTSVRMGGGRQRAARLRLHPTDAGSPRGEGPEVRGSALALLLAVSGRPVREGELTGPGVETLLGRR